MKQTILSKCFSKMKRVALTLFAALCVGSVWAEEGEVTTPEVTPEPDPAPSTSALSIDPSAGYILTGLGELGDQVAVVFTNNAAIATWKAPKDLKNVEFLAVGGGGGGGGAVNYNAYTKQQGGAGGGGGGVVIGFIKDLSANATVSVTVGNGGPGGTGAYKSSGTPSKGTGAPTSNSSSSIITIDNVMYITAPGGGSAGGYNNPAIATGGSNSGGTKSSTDTALASFTYVGADAANNISNAQLLRNKGGLSYTSSSGYSCGGGGGGATEPGYASGGSKVGGRGGFGYESYITGERVVYGAGGGGGTGRSGGTGTYIEEVDLPFVEGAGLGGVGTADGSAGLANQGGGGGGGSYGKNGGAGGSGVVILRFGYSETDITVDATANISPKVLDKVYTGAQLTSGLEDTYAYTVEELSECVNVGAKVVRVTLNEGYVWSDDTTERYKDFTWNILKQENNVWTTEPFIHLDSWPQAFADSVIFNRAVPLAGELIATIAKGNGENQPFNGNLPTDPGTYKLIYKVEDTSNQSDLYWEKTFTIYPSEAFAEGYKVYGLGEKGDEVAVVFTRSGSWTVPANLKNAQFLVVGGGGGGGADVGTDDQRMAGAGGGGGGVVTGYINLPKNQVVTITVGTGGTGGIRGQNGLSSKKGAAQSAATDSLFSLDASHYVKAYAGGADMGSTDVSASKGGQQGGAGGSSAGSRPTNTNVGGSANKGDVASGTVISSTKYGNKGGKGASQYQAGGGGGATAVGGNGVAGSGGVGGEGLASDITGALLVYGSGGGGGGITAEAANGGTGAGNGGRYNNATSGVPNQGGGGGGAGRVGNGGNGGSGIVVFRYKVYAAEVNSTPYDTLSEAISKAADGATITVLNDCTADTACVIANKTLTIDLNGKTVKANDTAAATDGNGVFWVQAGGVLTLEDSSEDKSGTVDGNGGNDYKMAIWADGGKVVINAGNYVNENDGTHTQYDLIYAKNGGEIVINGGTFKCDSPRWTLNSHNTKTGTFVVTGGKFYQYNPTDFDTDEAVTTWCDAKYRAELDEDGWYIVKEGYTLTVTAPSVNVETEEAANAVRLDVVAPENLSDEEKAAYVDYFEKKVTSNAEGGFKVELALVDAVKPVIAETTADDTTKEAFVIDADGNVTLNISNKKPGLYYGVQVLAELGADPVAVVPETEAGALVVTADNIPDGNAAFFRVVVDFAPIATPDAE